MTDRRFRTEKAEVGRQADRIDPANFKLVYESNDGKLCLFEDALGHLTAVRAAKLA